LGQKLRDSKRNECTANHSNPVYPTTLKTGVLEESYVTPDLDDDLSSDEEEEEEEIEEEIPIATNEMQMPLVAVTQEIMVETINIEDTIDRRIEELTGTIDRLREQLVDTNVELVKAQALLRQNRYRQRNDSFSKKPQGMSNSTYMDGLGKGFLGAFKGTKSRKKKKVMASELFASLDDDPDMMDLMVTYGKRFFQQKLCWV
jgi:hypothetical protein